MRAVVQRVLEARVQVERAVVGEIGKGILVFLGVAQEDSHEDVRILADKVVHLRLFPDADDKMNRSVLEIDGGILVVSQFTLLGDCRKGRRPSYAAAATPDQARGLYEAFVAALRQVATVVATGRFQELMQVQLINDGPVTLLIDSRKTF